MVLNQLLTSMDDPNPQQLAALVDLLSKMNKLEDAYGQVLSVTSGFRSWADQVRIYKAKNDALKVAGKDQVPVPLYSGHLDGVAVDVADPKGRLQYFLSTQPESALETFGLYYESFAWTPDYVHCQTRAPASKKRFYRPY